MGNRYLFCFMLLGCSWLSGLPQHRESGSVADSLLEQAMKLHHEQILVRVDLGSLFRWQNGPGWGGTARVGLEGKITDHWSLLGEVSSRFVVLPGDRTWPVVRPESGGINLEIAPRYYRRLLDLGAPSPTASGFSASYWTLRISTLAMPHSDDVQTGTRYFSDNISFAPMMGLQQRLWQLGYIDAAFGVRVNYLDTRASARGRWPLQPGWNILPTALVQVGLGVGR